MLPRLLTDCAMTEVLVRVGYRIVQLEYRREPKLWEGNKALRTLQIAEGLRENGYNNLYWTLNGAARWLAQGIPLHQWKREAPTSQGVRAFHKRSGRGR